MSENFEQQIFELNQKMKNVEKVQQHIEEILKKFAPDMSIAELEKKFEGLSEEELLAKIKETDVKIKELETMLQI